ncbi:MAG: hypothetical protein IJ189_13050 [Clostridia bacterium]|nr:hypothetical protein [Clostridia bacterium]
MNTFSNSLFTFLFGWARSLIESVWNAAAEGKLSGFFTWLGDHWMIVVVALCLGGTVMDFLIWMIRWRPYLVWRSFLRKWARRFRGEKVDSQRRFNRGYQDAVEELGFSAEQSDLPPQDAGAWEDEYAAPAQEQADYYQEDAFAAPQDAAYADQQWAGETPAGYAPDVPEGRRRRRSEKHDQPRRFAWHQKLTAIDDQEEDGMLDGLPPAVNREQAFHEPVYPESYTAWQQANGTANGKNA